MRRRWESFHAQCQEVFGFPALCGANMDAWIDCLTYLYDGDGMSRFVLQPDEWLRIRLRNTDALRRCQPGILKALVERTEFTNQRYRDAGEPPLSRSSCCRSDVAAGGTERDVAPDERCRAAT